MFMCDKGFSCCNFQHWDRWEDVEEDAKECGNLLEVDVVKHGKWITMYEDIFDVYRCSNCGETVFKKTNYCYNCGANMTNEVSTEVKGDDC